MVFLANCFKRDTFIATFHPISFTQRMLPAFRAQRGKHTKGVPNIESVRASHGQNLRAMILWMVTKSVPTTLKPWKPLFVGIYRGIESFQGFLGGAGFRPSTVCSDAVSNPACL